MTVQARSGWRRRLFDPFAGFDSDPKTRTSPSSRDVTNVAATVPLGNSLSDAGPEQLEARGTAFGRGGPGESQVLRLAGTTLSHMPEYARRVNQIGHS